VTPASVLPWEEGVAMWWQTAYRDTVVLLCMVVYAVMATPPVCPVVDHDGKVRQ
jgi:hypothetical protein